MIIPRGTKQILPGNYTQIKHIFPYEGQQDNSTILYLPKSVTILGRNAFHNCVFLKSVIIPNSVKIIDYGAFRNCLSLKSIVIPDSVTLISDNAFRDCTSLISIITPNSILSIDDNCFKGCTSLMSIIISINVKIICYQAFCDCTSLRSIIIPEGIISISYEAFKNCTSLTSIFIPSSVTLIDEPFYNCPKLRCVLDNTRYSNEVLKQLINIPSIQINMDINDHLDAYICLRDYFEGTNVIKMIVFYLTHNLLIQLIRNGIDVNKIDYI